MHRVFDLDALRCPRCAGWMEHITRGGRRHSVAGRSRLTTPTDSGRIAGTLLGRIGEPVAATALVLACSDGSYFTGRWRLPNGRLLMG